MARARIGKPFALAIIAFGVVLLLMYGGLTLAGGRPSLGMFVVGLSDLTVGIILLRRAKAAGA